MPSRYDDNSWKIWVATLVTIIPATVAVVARLIVRHSTRGVGLRSDDYTILAALVANWAQAVLRWVEIIYYGFGRHANTLPKYQLESYLKTFLAVQICYFCSSALTRTSILLLYNRIFVVDNKSAFRKVLIAVGSLYWAYFIACVVVCIFGCNPVSLNWDKTAKGSCINEVQFFRWNGVGNMLLDILTLCLPFYKVWHLRQTKRQRFALTLVFCVGGLVCITSILRVIAFNSANLKDTTYTTIDTGCWSSAEQSLGIFCASLPPLRQLLRKTLGNRQDSSRDKASHGSLQATGRDREQRENGLDLKSLGTKTGSRLSPDDTSSMIGLTEDGHNHNGLHV